MNKILDPKKHQFFRANIGVIVIDDKGSVLSFRRKGRKGSWQFPQGGLDQGESILAAALRELSEETGLTSEDVEYVAEYPDWLYYELPKKLRNSKNGRGQIQKWLLFWLSDPKIVDLSKAPHKEFDKFRWTSISQVVEEVVYFRKPVYKVLEMHFAKFFSLTNE